MKYQAIGCAIPLLVASMLIQAESMADVEWTGWLGPNRDGQSNAFDPPTDWPEKLTKQWQVKVGTGYGSPLVSGGRVFQHARQNESEVVWCLDLASGDVVWRKEYPTPFKMGGGGEQHGKGPKSSPVLSAGRLFTMSITGTLRAWDTKSGELLWKRDYRDLLSKTHPYWGASTSPIVDENRVIAHFGSDDEGMLVALDVASGQEIWTQGNDGASYSSPLLAELDGVRQIVEWNHRALVGVESKTGRLLWEQPFPHAGHNQNMPTPAVHKGCVLLGGENRGIHSFCPQLDNGAWSVTEKWHQDKVALDMSSAIINNDLLFGFSHYGKGKHFCLNPTTGDILWQGPGRTGQNVMYLSITDHLVALLDNGQLQFISANSDGFRSVAAFRVATTPTTWAPPVMLPDGVLIKDLDTVARWSFRD